MNLLNKNVQYLFLLIQKFYNKYKQEIVFHLMVNVITGIFITYSSYYHIPLKNLIDFVAYFLHFSIIQFSIASFIYFINLNRFIFYITFPILFIIYSICAFFRYTQDITITSSIVQVMFLTEAAVIFEFITFHFIIYLLVIFMLIFLILKYYKKLAIQNVSLPFVIIPLLGISLFFLVEYKRPNTLRNYLPYSLLISINKYFQKPVLKFTPTPKITSTKNKMNIIFVLGESVRAKNLQLNGYSRETTPSLKLQDNLISFPYVVSHFSYTTQSLKQILTNFSLEKEVKLYSLYSVLNKLNFNTSWISNPAPKKTYESLVFQNKTVRLIDPGRSVYSYHKKFDEDIIPVFKEIFQNDKNKQFITIHTIGSHWWYESRYPDKFRKFQPVIDSKYIPSLSKDQMINSYDNTILYLDYFLNLVINILKKPKVPILLVYLADHGELLGENGKWLHAQGEIAGKNPAMLIWFNQKFKHNYPNEISALKSNQFKPITTDFVFHSILDLLDVHGLHYDKSKSIFFKHSKYDDLLGIK